MRQARQVDTMGNWGTSQRLGRVRVQEPLVVGCIWPLGGWVRP